ncbi:hypothetical protein [Acinetobacter sp. MD2(2019)]|uniref:hypothetical protein n=1 Tax=Acinetobacter sp. MD2(2019) TaxID=2605273 RepID=UPI002D1EAAFF|nr:hypothetical protein [Acinetobacter sp. MD2(2019)]MEB3754521.1 hypothetical protein [Acinetobacter sp. MD2(2019)]
MQKIPEQETQKEPEGCLAALFSGILEAVITIFLTGSIYGLYLMIGMAAAWLLLPYLVIIYYVFGRRK